MHENSPNTNRKHANGSDPFGFSALEESRTSEHSANSPEQDKQRNNLIKEINEQIPFLAYGLSETIRQNGLGGKISIRGMMGDDWGVGVSKNNPRKDIPNIIIYPESILAEDRTITNARLRHEIGNLNHSIEGEMAELTTWCAKHDQNYKLIAPLVEAVQEASVNYLEIKNSIADDPVAAFRPLYEKIIPIKDIAEHIGSAQEYKQAIDMTLLKSLSIDGLVDSATLDTAYNNISDDVRTVFSKKTDSIIEQAVKTSSGKIRVQLVRDYLWPEFSKFVPPTIKQIGNENQFIEQNKSTATMQQALETIEHKNLSSEERDERDAIDAFLMKEIQNKANELVKQLSDLNFKKSSTQATNQNTESGQRQSQDLQEQLNKLQPLLEDLQNPEKASGDDLEGLQFKINEVGINEAELDAEQLKLLTKLRDFCHSTTVTYVRTLRFIMEEYQHHNPNFTDKMMQKMILHGHDTPSFTIYGREAGEDFINNTCAELGFEDFQSSSMVLNFNLPDILGRLWYRGGAGAKAQPIPDEAIEWGYFYRSSMPAIWRSVDAAPREGLILNRLNAFGQHDYKKYYYLYDAMNINLNSDGQDNPPKSDEETDEETNEEYNEAGNNSNSNTDEIDDITDEKGDTNELDDEGDSANIDDTDGITGTSSMSDDGNLDDKGTLAAMQKQLSNMFSELDSLMNDQDNIQSDINENDQDNDEPNGSGAPPNKHNISELFGQLRETQAKLESSFSNAMAKRDGFREYDIDDQDIEPNTVESIENLEAIKAQQRRQLEEFYHEQSGLSGKTLERYIEYREETKAFTDDLTAYFTEKFKLDKEYDYISNQRRGNRLQRGWTSKILGRTALDAMAVEPEIFEHKSIPKKPQFIWSVIIDNSGSCDGDIIEEEKKTAIALTETAERLNIPLEIVTFGGPNEYTFLKTFDQELYGEQLAKIVELEADEGTPDVITLNAACTSVVDYAENFNRSFNFVYFMTDGESEEGSIQSIIKKFQRDIVITGVGLGEAANTISSTWGRSAVGVEDVSRLSDKLIRKIEDQVEETFD